MLFRVTFIAAYLVFVLNVQAVLGIALANPVEKALFLLAAFSALLTRKKDPVVLALLGCTFLLVFVQALFVKFPGFEWGTLISSLNQFTIVYAFLSIYPTEKDRSVLLRFMPWLAPISACLGVVYNAAGILPSSAVEFASGVVRFNGSLFAPAYLSGIAMIGAFSALQVVLKEKRRFYLLIIAVNLVVLLLAGGRATLVVALALMASSVAYERSILLSKKIALFGTGAVLVAVLVGLQWERISTRFLNSGSNGREFMWDYLLSLNQQYPEGIGFGHQYFAVPEEIRIVTGSFAAHNDFVRIGLELSYPGMYIFYGLLALAIFRLSHRAHLPAGPLLTATFAGFLLLTNSDNVIATPPYFPMLLMGYLASVSFPRPSQDAARPTPPEPASLEEPEIRSRFGATA